MSPASFENVRAKVSKAGMTLFLRVQPSVHFTAVSGKYKVWGGTFLIFFLTGNVKCSLKRQKSICLTSESWKFKACETLLSMNRSLMH